MSNNNITKKTNFDTQAKPSINYTPEELAKATQSYEEATPKQIENNTIIKVKVIEIAEKDVILDTGLKFDGIVALNEFKDLPNLKIGDELEVYVEAVERKHKEILLSRKKLEAIKGWQNIEEALITQVPLEATVKKTSPGGLITNIQGVEAFLPGSQIDVNPITDYEAFVDTKIQVVVINISHAKKNVIVSRKIIIKENLEEQKRAIVEKLEEGQILEGVVKNIEKYGAFVDLGGVTGLVYIKDMVWSKRIDHPSKAKDEQGNLMFEKDKKVKVVVLSFDKEKNHVSLATKPLLPHPWEKLAKEVQENSIIKCKVVKIMDYGAIVETTQGIEAFMYNSDMSYSIQTQHPKEIIEIDQEIEVMVLRIDVEKQSLRVGIKQLIPDPWQDEEFFIKYGLNTRHKAKVTNFTEHGAYLELAPRIEGFLHNRHLSWSKKINTPSTVLKKDELNEILIIGIDESKKRLELGLRELEESPWDDFQKTFIPGSTHKGVILRKIPQGLIVKLTNGPESFIANKDITKKEKSELEIGKELDLIVVEFMKYEEKVHISHDALFETSTKSRKYSKPIDLITAEKTTLEDIALVSDAKKEGSPAENKETKA